MFAPGTILIVDDQEDILTAARLLLKQHGWEVHTERGPHNLPAVLNERTFDVILLDMNFSREGNDGKEGFHWLNRILSIDPTASVVMITAFGDIAMAVRAIKEGATDFVLKPWENEKLIATVSAAAELRRSHTEIDRLRSRERHLVSDLGHGFREFVGRSQPMLRLFDLIAKVAVTDANVLILGENGTGKELVAREIHRQSARASEILLTVDMGALSEGLFESELFGHQKGAFTDAREDRAGRFEAASGGTLFLDEIANIPLALQPKLLSVLQNRQVTRVGSNIARPVDIRLICATNRSLHDMVAEKTFREDLLYRINTVELHIPPLRDRADDIPLLADHFIARFSHQYHKAPLSFAADAMAQLQRHRWPGNIRELQHTIERAVVLATGPVIHAEDLSVSAPSTPGGAAAEGLNLEEIERTVIMQAVAKHRGNITQAAMELGLTRAALYRRLEKHGL